MNKKLDLEFDEKLKKWKKQYQKSAKKLGLTFAEYMMMLFQNELIYINQQLTCIHEHLDKNHT